MAGNTKYSATHIVSYLGENKSDIALNNKVKTDDGINLGSNNHLHDLIVEYQYKLTPISIAVLLVSIGVAWLTIAKINDLHNFLLSIVIGILLAFISILPHELIHLIGYKFFGARKVGLSIKPRKGLLLSYAIDSKFSLTVYGVITFLPFVALSILAYAFMKNEIVFLAFMMMHIMICSGDIAILNYLYLHRKSIKIIDCKSPHEVWVINK